MRPSFFQRRKLQNFIDRFLLRAVDKAAGIHDCNVCKRSVIAQLKTRVFQARHQHFAVHLVFGTAKADHSHFNCHVYNPFSVHIQALDMPLYNFCSAATYFSRKRAAFQSKCRPFTKIIQLYAQKHACRPEIMPFSTPCSSRATHKTALQPKQRRFTVILLNLRQRRSRRNRSRSAARRLRRGGALFHLRAPWDIFAPKWRGCFPLFPNVLWKTRPSPRR